MKIVFYSLRGAPGVTTLALLCAASWHRECVLVEADPAGGVLARRYGLSPSPPNLMSLAAASRHGISEENLYSASRELPDEVPAVLAPAKGFESRQALQQLPLEHLPRCSTDLLIDRGRLLFGGSSEDSNNSDGNSNCANTFGADLLVVIVTPIFEQLCLLMEFVETVGSFTSLGVVLSGKGPYSPGEVREHLKERCGHRASVLGVLPHDPKGAALVYSEGPAALLTRRSRLYRAASSLSDFLCTSTQLAN